MKTKVFLGIAVRIILLFGAAMLFTFIPEQLREFFGDTPHLCETGECSHNYPSNIDWEWHWGTRHYWYPCS